MPTVSQSVWGFYCRGEKADATTTGCDALTRSGNRSEKGPEGGDQRSAAIARTGIHETVELRVQKAPTPSHSPCLPLGSVPVRRGAGR